MSHRPKSRSREARGNPDYHRERERACRHACDSQFKVIYLLMNIVQAGTSMGGGREPTGGSRDAGVDGLNRIGATQLVSYMFTSRQDAVGIEVVAFNGWWRSFKPWEDSPDDCMRAISMGSPTGLPSNITSSLHPPNTIPSTSLVTSTDSNFSFACIIHGHSYSPKRCLQVSYTIPTLCIHRSIHMRSYAGREGIGIDLRARGGLLSHDPQELEVVGGEGARLIEAHEVHLARKGDAERLCAVDLSRQSSQVID